MPDRTKQPPAKLMSIARPPRLKMIYMPANRRSQGVAAPRAGKRVRATPLPAAKLRAVRRYQARKEAEAGYRNMPAAERLGDVNLERLVWSSLAPSTITRYKEAVAAMQDFTAELGLDPECSGDVGRAFARYLIEAEGARVAASTVRTRYHAVRKWDAGRGIDTDNHWSKSPTIKAALAGYDRIDLNQREKEVRFPYSDAMVIELQEEAERQGEPDLAWGFELLYNGGMRSGHLERDAEGRPKLRQGDVRLVINREGEAVCQITLRAIKGRAQQAAVATIMVPANIGQYIKASCRDPGDPALPRWDSQRALRLIDKVMVEKGWDPNYVYDLHALRRAMATKMVASGCTQQQVREQGLWAEGSMVPFTHYAMSCADAAQSSASCTPQPLGRVDEGSKRMLPSGSPTWPHRAPRQPDLEPPVTTRGVRPTAGQGTGRQTEVTWSTVPGKAEVSTEWEPVVAQTTVGGRAETASTGGAVGGALATSVRKYSYCAAMWRRK
jgi:hypothetical protein